MIPNVHDARRDRQIGLKWKLVGGLDMSHTPAHTMKPFGPGNPSLKLLTAAVSLLLAPPILLQAKGKQCSMHTVCVNARKGVHA